MYFFGPWHVLEDPSQGKAILEFRLKANGEPLDLRDDPADGASFPQGPAILSRCPRFTLTAKPWANGGKRPFVCDYFPLDKRVHKDGPAGVILLVVGRDVAIEDKEFSTEFGEPGFKASGRKQRQPHLEIQYVRVQDVSWLPDIGEALAPSSLLASSEWKYFHNYLYELEEAREQGVNTTAFEKELEEMKRTHASILAKTFEIEHHPFGLEMRTNDGDVHLKIETPGAHANSPQDPSAFSWELITPVTEKIFPSTLRVVCTRNVKITYSLFHEGKRSSDVVPFLCVVSRVPEVEAVPPEGSRLNGFAWTGVPWIDDYKEPGDRFYAAVERAMLTTFAESPGLAMLPLFFLGPEVALIAAELAVSLSIAGIVYTLDQRRVVAERGVNMFGKSMTQEEAERAVYWSMAGLVLDALGALKPGIEMAKLARTSTRLPDLAMLRQIARAAPPVLRSAMRDLPRAKLQQLLLRLRRADAAVARRIGEELRKLFRVEETLLLDVEVRQIFTDDFGSFKLLELRQAYAQYWWKKEQAAAKLGAAAARRARARILDPIDWLTARTRKNAPVRKLMGEILGPQWVQKIQRARELLPVRQDLNEMFEFLRMAGPMSRKQLDLYRKSKIKPVGRWLQFEHTVENRMVESLASRAGRTANDLLDYKKAVVVTVAVNSKVARQIAGYRGYTHTLKTRWLDMFIPQGSEAEYTLQQMCDATLFTLASLGGRENGGLELAMKTFKEIADQLKEPIIIRVLPMEEFAVGKWKYLLPDEEAVLHMDAVRQRIEALGILE